MPKVILSLFIIISAVNVILPGVLNLMGLITDSVAAYYTVVHLLFFGGSILIATTLDDD